MGTWHRVWHKVLAAIITWLLSLSSHPPGLSLQPGASKSWFSGGRKSNSVAGQPSFLTHDSLIIAGFSKRACFYIYRPLPQSSLNKNSEFLIGSSFWILDIVGYSWSLFTVEERAVSTGHCLCVSLYQRPRSTGSWAWSTDVAAHEQAGWEGTLPGTTMVLYMRTTTGPLKSGNSFFPFE